MFLISFFSFLYGLNIVGVLINVIRVKHFRAFTLVAEVVRNFFADVGRFNKNVVSLKYGC